MAPLVLAIATASAGAAVAMVRDGEVLAASRHTERQGLAASLPLLVADLVARAGRPDLVTAVVGPGSFTGLRAGLSVALGIGAGAGVPVIGVSVAEAIAEALPALGTRSLWVAMPARAGHLFLDRDGDLASFACNNLPRTRLPVAVAGEAANQVASILAASGANVMLTSARHPKPRHVALVALRRAAGHLSPLPAVPLYVDPPLAKRPASGLRPAPV